MRSALASFGNVWAEACGTTPVEIRAGRDWWAAAFEAVAQRATEERPYERMAHAVAAASPGIPWAATLQNIDVLLDAMSAGREIPTGPGCGLELPLGRKHVDKAWGILRGGSLSLCRGPKVEALAANLLGDMNVVTVDRHVTWVATAGAARQVWRGEARRIQAMVTMAAFAIHCEPAILMTVFWMRRARLRQVAGAALDPYTSAHEIALRRLSA